MKWNLGYSIISREAIQKELEEESLSIVNVEDLMIEREFNFVWRKGEKCTFIDEFIKFAIKGV